MRTGDESNVRCEATLEYEREIKETLKPHLDTFIGNRERNHNDISKSDHTYAVTNTRKVHTEIPFLHPSISRNSFIRKIH